MKKVISAFQNVQFYALSIAIAMFGYVGFAHAAADADLVDALASTTAVLSDNKSTIMNYIVGIALIILVIALAKKAIMWGVAKILGAFGGRRRRR